MRFEITGAAKRSVKTSTTLPPEYKKFQLPTSQILVVTSSVADIIYQERTVRGCSQCNIIFIIKKPCALRPTVKGPFSAINCMLKGSVEVKLKGEINVILYQGQYNAFQVDDSDHIAYFQPGYYEANHFDYTRNAIAALADSSEIVHRWLNMIDNNEAAAVMPAPGIIWGELYRLVNELKITEIKSSLMEEWLFTKLTEILIITLHDQHGKHKVDEENNPLFETIGSYIANNLEQPINVSQLAKDYGMSESKLKKDFTKYFGKSFTEYLKEHRMCKAKDLLQREKKTVSETAYLVGYHHPGSLTREYKDFFGVLPSHSDE